MFGFGEDEKQVEPLGASDGALDRAANSLAQHLIATGIDGVASFDSAQKVAEQALKTAHTRDAAVDAIVNSHTKLVGVNGFVTNLGGFVTLPVSLPANVVGFYTVATRMVAAIAHVSGANVRDEAVRSAILLDLIGTDATQVLKGMGTFTGGVATNVATRKLPPAALAVVNKAVAFRLVAKVGGRFLSRIPRLVPVAGGFVGAGLDIVLLRKIAESARKDFAASLPPAA